MNEENEYEETEGEEEEEEGEADGAGDESSNDEMSTQQPSTVAAILLSDEAERNEEAKNTFVLYKQERALALSLALDIIGYCMGRTMQGVADEIFHKDHFEDLKEIMVASLKKDEEAEEAEGTGEEEKENMDPEADSEEIINKLSDQD